MQARAWRRIRGEAAKLAERDREVAARERRVREEEEAMAQGAHRVLPDPEEDPPSTDVEGRSPSGKRAREEKEEAAQERGKRRQGEEWGAGGAEAAPRPARPRPRADADRLGLGAATAAAVCAAAGTEGARDGRGVDNEEMAELVRYVKWAGRTTGRWERRGARPFSDLVGRAGRPGERGPEMEEGRWRRML